MLALPRPSDCAIGDMSWMSIALIQPGVGPQGPPGATGGFFIVQRNAGKFSGYNQITAAANVSTGLVVAGPEHAHADCDAHGRLVVGGQLHRSNMMKIDAAYHYLILVLNMSVADQDGLSSVTGEVITQHSQVQQYEGRTCCRIFRLAKNTTYTVTPQFQISGGTWQYYTANTHLWIEGKLWAQ